MSAAPLTGLLLAAGRGRRFGGNKILARLADGRAVGLAAAAALAAAVERVLVVVDGDGGETERAFAAAGYVTCRAPEAALGMGHSLARGIGASTDSSGWLVALGDMPYVRPETIIALAAALRAGAPIVVPSHAGRDGHPVGFAAALADELGALRGDRGARAVIERDPARVERLVVTDAGILRDVDTPADLAGGGDPDPA